jgi:ribosomal protein S3
MSKLHHSLNYELKKIQYIEDESLLLEQMINILSLFKDKLFCCRISKICVRKHNDGTNVPLALITPGYLIDL